MVIADWRLPVADFVSIAVPFRIALPEVSWLRLCRPM
jgi:hypothetical protein